MAMAFPVSVTCPSCQTTIMTHVHNIIDVGQDPELKTQFLQGQLNVATCPQCGQSGMLAMPLLYHDPAKELLFVFVPDQLNIKIEDRERLVGELVNELMNSILPESRRAYLLQPQTFLSIDRLIREILKADGITDEMLDAQRRAIELIGQLLEAQDDEEAFDQLVEEHREALDYEFFALLSAVIESTEQAGEAGQSNELLTLRQTLLEAVMPPVPEPLPEDATYEDLITALVEAEDEQALQGIAVSNRALINYGFFLALSAKIEQLEASGEAAQATKLETIRAQVLDLVDEMDKQMQDAQDKRRELVEELLAADEVEPVLQKNMDRLDMLLFAVLGNMAAEDESRAEALLALQKKLAGFVESQLPPELRLLSLLTSTTDPAVVDGLLRDHADIVDADFASLIETVLADYASQGGEEPPEVEQLCAVLAKVQSKLL